MKFPYTMWVIAQPEGGHCPFLMQPTRGECIDAFKKWYGDGTTWTRARRKGWKCVKMQCSPANTKISRDGV